MSKDFLLSLCSLIIYYLHPLDALVQYRHWMHFTFHFCAKRFFLLLANNNWIEIIGRLSWINRWMVNDLLTITNKYSFEWAGIELIQRKKKNKTNKQTYKIIVEQWRKTRSQMIANKTTIYTIHKIDQSRNTKQLKHFYIINEAASLLYFVFMFIYYRIISLFVGILIKSPTHLIRFRCCLLLLLIFMIIGF